MDVELLSLSGEPVAAVKALPSETIFNLKEKLYSSTPSACTFVIQLCLDGECLEDTNYMGDLKRGSKLELQVIRTRKGARELLFETPEDALCLAQHYDALGAEECKKQISAILMDADGKELGCRAKMEVLLALCNRLSKPKKQPNMVVLKVALAELSVEVLVLKCHDEDAWPTPNTRHKDLLFRCFLWLGQEALLILLGYDLAVEATLVSEFAKRPLVTLKEMIQQLPPDKDAKSPVGKLRSIIKSSVQQIKGEHSKRRVSWHRRHGRHGIDGQLAVPTLLDNPQQVLSAASKDCLLHVLGDNTVELRYGGGHPLRQATRRAALDAVLLDPFVMLRQVDWYLALEAVEKSHGVYNYLPPHLQADLCFLYAALERDDALLSDFLSTASKHEIRQWRWHMEQRPVKKKR